MRKSLAPLTVLLLCGSFAASASADDVVRYLSCRADNETTESIIALDETTKKVCDRGTGSSWFEPSVFDKAKIEWSDGAGSTKSIFMKSKGGKRYEHDTFILVHIGHCKKVAAPPTQLCKS